MMFIVLEVCGSVALYSWLVLELRKFKVYCSEMMFSHCSQLPYLPMSNFQRKRVVLHYFSSAYHWQYYEFGVQWYWSQDCLLIWSIVLPISQTLLGFFCLSQKKRLSDWTILLKYSEKLFLPYTLVMKLELTFSTSYLPLPFGFMLAIIGLPLLSTSDVTIKGCLVWTVHIFNLGQVEQVIVVKFIENIFSFSCPPYYLVDVLLKRK